MPHISMSSSRPPQGRHGCGDGARRRTWHPGSRTRPLPCAVPDRGAATILLAFEEKRAHGHEHHYNYGLVALSVLIAILASYAALDLAGRTTAARGARRWIWLTAAPPRWASASGRCTTSGCWRSAAGSGPLRRAHRPRLAPRRHPRVGRRALRRQPDRLTVLSVVVGSIIMGSGIAAMHYIGMAAMRVPAMHHYDGRLVALSVALAIVISLVALLLTFLFRDEVAVAAGASSAAPF